MRFKKSAHGPKIVIFVGGHTFRFTELRDFFCLISTEQLVGLNYRPLFGLTGDIDMKIATPNQFLLNYPVYRYVMHACG